MFQPVRPHLELYLVFGPQDRPEGSDLVGFLDQALAGGTSMVQWRDKTSARQAPLSQRCETIQPLQRLCRTYGVPFIINDDLDLAEAGQADGLHLGQDDAHPLTARKRLGEKAILGWSVGTAEEKEAFLNLQSSLADGNPRLDYLGMGPAFSTATKSDAGKALGPAGLKQLAQELTIPLVAIGGINADNAELLKDLGLDGLAVVSAITSKSDPKAAVEKLRHLWLHPVTI